MEVNNLQLKKMIEERFAKEDWNFSYDRESGKLRIEDKQTQKGITLSLSGVVAKWETRKEKAFEEVVYYIEEAMRAMTLNLDATGKEAHIFPVIRSTSFPKETKDEKQLIFEEHTAETRIYYALDLGKTYRLIDEEFANAVNWTKERIKEIARFNVRSLNTSYKEDVVAGNTFYFINSNDGYDASRILNDSLLEKMAKKAKGKLAVAVPHQDVLIFADIENDEGYDILAQLTMSFFAEGNIPITALPFLYENKQLEPIFILAKNKPRRK